MGWLIEAIDWLIKSSCTGCLYLFFNLLKKWLPASPYAALQYYKRDDAGDARDLSDGCLYKELIYFILNGVWKIYKDKAIC